MVTTGSQQGLSLLTQTLVDPGDVVLVESPSYLAALQCFQLAGATLVAVPSKAGRGGGRAGGRPAHLDAGPGSGGAPPGMRRLRAVFVDSTGLR